MDLFIFTMPRLKIENIYMEIAYSIAKLSYAERRKVGCVVVKDNQIVSFGYNGTPHNFENECEELVIKSGNNLKHKKILEMDGYVCVDDVCSKTVTKREVLHAESNALSKIAKSTLSSDGATLYTTTSPCFECSKSIIQSGITTVYYNETYRDMSGVELLTKANIKVIKIDVI
jgi:dCMP deaminase